MYYPDEVIEEVRSRNDIVDVVGSYVKLKKQGANYFGLCPFHNEKSPSFSVSRDKQMFYCFGCGAGGNVITFVMKYENITFPEAVKELAARAGVPLPEQEFSAEMRQEQERKKLLFAVNKETAVYYYKLLRSPVGRTGLSYLTDRKLSPETMHNFGLGYADGRNSDLVRHLREEGFDDSVILESGVAAFDEKHGLHDKFWNRVIFPIMDIQNRVIGFGGRVMGDGKPKYLNSPETKIFNKGENLYALNFARKSRADRFILCEGYMDVISMHQAGFTQAVASLGTSFTTGQARVLKRYVKEVLLSYDSDEAGTKAAIRNNGILRDAGVRAKVLHLEPYKDPDEFIKAIGGEEFQKRIDTAENAFLFEIRKEQEKYDLQDPGSRSDFVRAAAAKTAGITDEIERDSYIRIISSKYMVDEKTFRTMVGLSEEEAQVQEERAARIAARRNASARPAEEESGESGENAGGSAGAYADGGAALPGDGTDSYTGRPASRTKEEQAVESADLRAQRYLLTWLADDPALIRQVSAYISPDDFSAGVYRTAASEFFRNPDKPAEEASIISLFVTEKEQMEAAALFNTHLDMPEKKEDREKALRDIVYQVKKGSLQRSRFANAGGKSSLSETIENKKKLEQLARAHFYLKD
jgi:DNA primase